MTVIAFDFGTKNIGIAIGQKFTRTANPLQSIKVKSGIPNWNLLNKTISEWMPQYAIVGLPLNINGTKQKITYKSENFAKQIQKKFNMKVYLHDERLSTIEAKSIIFQKQGFRFLKKNIIDSQSAVIILESWFFNN